MSSNVASTSALPTTTELTPQIMSAFKPSKIFRKHNTPGSPFTSLAFDDRGDYVLTSAADETMQLFNCKTGKHHKQFYSKKYGVDLARFTHKSTVIIHASTKGDDAIRYLSLHDNNYLRYFKGHKKKVVSLEMAPGEDGFMSGATDDTVRLWDIRSENASGLLNIAGRPVVAYDPSGDVFAVALNLAGGSLSLYDLRKYDKEPFATITLIDPVYARDGNSIPIFTSIKFSNDGSKILVGTSGDVHYVVDAFEFGILARLTCPSNVMGLSRSVVEPYQEAYNATAGVSGNEVCWTPDSRYVVSGAIDGKIHTWDVNPPPNFDPQRPLPGPECTLYPLRTHEGHLKGTSRCVAFNPRNAMMVTAGNDLAFWLPDPVELQHQK